MSFHSIFFALDGRLRSGWRFALGAVVFVAAEFLAAGVASFVPVEHRLLVELVNRGLALALLLGGFALLLRTVDGVAERPLAHMGLAVRGAPVVRLSLVGMAIGAAMVATCVALIAALGSVQFQVEFNRRSVARAMVVMAVLAVAAMVEEAAFRGYPFQRLVEGVRPVGAVLLASLFFGLIHAGNPNVSRIAIVNTVLIGVALAAAYLRTQSLWLPWGVHFGWNAALGLGFGLPLSGMRMFASVVRGRAAGPEWATGGAYGIEGSGLASVVIALGLGVIWWVTRGEARDRAPLSGHLFIGSPGH